MSLSFVWSGLKLFTGFTGLGEAFLHTGATPTPLSVELSSDTDGVLVGFRHPATKRSNLAPHSMS